MYLSSQLLVSFFAFDINSDKENFNTDSAATGIDRRIENPFRPEKADAKGKKADAKGKKADK